MLTWSLECFDVSEIIQSNGKEAILSNFLSPWEGVVFYIQIVSYLYTSIIWLLLWRTLGTFKFHKLQVSAVLASKSPKGILEEKLICFSESSKTHNKL